MRSKYIYQIYNKIGALVWSGTVKYEAHLWLMSSNYFTPQNTRLFRVEDGGTGGKIKYLVPIDWEPSMFEKDKPDWLQFFCEE